MLGATLADATSCEKPADPMCSVPIRRILLAPDAPCGRHTHSHSDTGHRENFSTKGPYGKAFEIRRRRVRGTFFDSSIAG